MLERLRSLFQPRPEQVDDEPVDPREAGELPAGPLTGLTSPLDVGGDRRTAEDPADSEHP